MSNALGAALPFSVYLLQLKIHVLFFEIRRTEDKFAMGGHVT